MLRILSFTVLVSVVLLIESCGYKSNEDSEKTDTQTEETNIETNVVEIQEMESDEVQMQAGSRDNNDNDEKTSAKPLLESKSLFDDRLKEAIANAKKGGVSPKFIVELVITKGMQKQVVETLNKLGVEMMLKEGENINIVSNPSDLEKISRIQGIEKINLITENYYPNR